MTCGVYLHKADGFLSWEFQYWTATNIEYGKNCAIFLCMEWIFPYFGTLITTVIAGIIVGWACYHLFGKRPFVIVHSPDNVKEETGSKAIEERQDNETEPNEPENLKRPTGGGNGGGLFFLLILAVVLLIANYEQTYEFQEAGPELISRAFLKWPNYEPVDRTPGTIFSIDADERSLQVAFSDGRQLQGRFDWRGRDLCFSLKNAHLCSVPGYDKIHQAIRIIDPLGDGENTLVLRPITDELPR